MKRIYTLTLAAIGATVALSAQSKLDPSASLLLQNVETNEAARLKARSGVEMRTLAPDIDPAQKVLVAVMITDDAAVEEMLSRGYELVNTTGSVIMCRLTPAQIREAADMEQIKAISLGQELQPLMSTARATTGVDDVQAGSEELGNRSFTGAGVVAGIMDTGLQPNHVNFLDDDGEPRISRLWVITGSGSTQNYDTPDKIKSYTTDTDQATHATHVLGILGGSFNGTPTNGGTSAQAGSMAIINASGRLQTSSLRPVPYYGVATDAELAVCIGTLQDNNILVAAEKVRDYAKEQGKPAVMNFSLGHNNGPHDGTSAQNQRLAELGEDMLICISAGNEGAYNMSLRKEFTASDNSVKTTLSTSTYANGYVDVWGDNSSIVTLTFIGVDKSTGAVKYSYKFDRNSQGSTVIIGGEDYRNYTNVTVDGQLNDMFGSSAMIQLRSNISTTNNRYNVYLTVQLDGSSRQNVVPGVIIEGREGNGVNAFSGSSGAIQFMSNGLSGYVDGTPDNSINDLGCGDNVLVVGAYVNASSYPALVGMIGYSGIEDGSIASFSSWGTPFGSNRQLPDVAGPGMGVISSYSRYYMEQFDPNQTGTDYYYRTGTVYAGTDRSTKEAVYDYYAAMDGTSMSSPFVAGVLALWLEADPTLTMDRVKEIISKTADHDEYTSQQPERWGSGKINALAGLKEILGTGAVNTVEADDAADNMIIEALGGKRYSVFVGGTDGFTVNLYNLQGTLMSTTSTDGGTAQIDASAFSEGIYLLEVKGKNLHTSRKFVVK